ncbi:DUF6702 family protein [Marixanthomonas spongiae]|uniref:Peptidase E n=1 Tax=Marixanthomonas spongiae TaxID=2174845 RepID=A0A2U0I7J9_9FLAO|nr:DUF6702 family protein [Marixanthomonas spongiae]PVW17020.1 hypothetical protein DDV96_00380 [Marixanthomonas spongiae]
MKFLNLVILAVLFPLMTASAPAHKFYVSTTNMEYVPQKKSVQIITRIFIDDIENVLQKRYDPSISIATAKETEKDIEYLKRYLFQKLKIKVNGKPATLKYIGREYDVDIVHVYIEITDVEPLHSIEIENKVLMDLFTEQQNIIHIKTPETRRSFILDIDNPKDMLNFD